MTPGDLENEVATPKIVYVIEIALINPVHKFGELNLDRFLGICPLAQIWETMTPGDLENEVVAPKSWYKLGIALKDSSK